MNLRTISDEGNLLKFALGYAARGWSIIPTRGKHPACPSWKHFQRCPAGPEALRDLFSRSGIDGLAVILGEVSGGLVCRDFDDAGAYHRWADAHAKLAQDLPTVQTSRGFHVYFTGPEGFRSLGDGEYRADSGHYCLVPPSRHPTGIKYRWLRALPAGQLPYLDPVEAGLVPGLENSSSCIQGGQILLAPQDPQATQETHCLCQTKPQEAVQSAILATLPTGPGQRNRKLFALARVLKVLIPHASNGELRMVVKEWHRLALAVIRTKGFSESWADFVNAWQNAKYPKGVIWASIVEQATAMPLPNDYDGASGLLVNLCRALQRHHGPGQPWPLSCRMAGTAIGVSHETAANLLKMLIFDEVLDLATPAGPIGSNRAAEYRLTRSW